jgi:DNA-binding CsgD family transcriptional regulator
MNRRTPLSPDIQLLLALTALTVNAVVLDATGTIVGVNASWQEFADANELQLPDYGVGLNYLKFCGADGQGDVLHGDINRLISGEIDVVTITYPCHAPDQMRWFLMIGLPLSRVEPAGATLLHINLTEFLPVAFFARELRSATRHLSSSDSAFTLDMIADVVRRSISETLAGVVLPALDKTVSLSPVRSASAVSVQGQIEKAQLSARHLQVFTLLGEGKSNLEIATALGISQNTIKLHVSEILRRLGVESRTQAALLACKLSSAEPDQPKSRNGNRNASKRPR